MGRKGVEVMGQGKEREKGNGKKGLCLNPDCKILCTQANFICKTRNIKYTQITNKCGRLPEKALAHQNWPPIALTNNSAYTKT